jgi:hypothetical protein
MRCKLNRSKACPSVYRDLRKSQPFRLAFTAGWSVYFVTLVLATETGIGAAQSPATKPDSTQPIRFKLPNPINEASNLLDRGRVDEATALLALIGTETLAKEAETLEKWPRTEVAKCQYFLGAYADCLDSAGPVPNSAPLHTPFGINYYGALAASRLQLWPLVVTFAGGDPEKLAQHLLEVGDKVEKDRVRQLSLCMAVGLARMDRFDEARGRIEKLVGSAKTQDEGAALRACLAQLEERERAVRAKEAKPFNASVFWLNALESPSWWVQTRAMREVARLPDPTVYDKLAARLKHPRWEVRDTVIGALSARGDRRAIQILRPLLQDPNANVRDSAKLALKELGEALD